MLADFDLSAIQDPGVRLAIVGLLNLIETLTAQHRVDQEEIQRLRDENNRLKGEQGQPTFKPVAPPPPANHSSEQERRRPQTWSKGSKLDRIVIDREQVLTVGTVDRECLAIDVQKMFWNLPPYLQERSWPGCPEGFLTIYSTARSTLEA